MHDRPLWIASAQIWSLHRSHHQFGRFGQEVCIRENVDHLCEARRKAFRFSVCSRATQCHERALFVVSADQLDAPTRAFLRENFFDDEIRARSLGEKVTDENDAAVATESLQPLEHL